MNKILLSARGIRKDYFLGKNKLEILKGIDLDIQQGESICITGSSGAGKSTLLHILGSLDRPTRGELVFEHQDIFKKSDEELARFRNQSLGFVFQFHHLLKEFSALENVMIPGRISGLSAAQSRERAESILNQVGLQDRLHRFPSEMSGGEQQRVAVARALVMKPRVLMADEPTGNLDTANGQRIQELFFELKASYGLTLIVVTHDKSFASRFPRVIEIRDGRLGTGATPSPSVFRK